MKIERGMKCKVLNDPRLNSEDPMWLFGHFQEWIAVNRDVWAIILHEDGKAKLHSMNHVLFNL